LLTQYQVIALKEENINMARIQTASSPNAEVASRQDVLITAESTEFDLVYSSAHENNLCTKNTTCKKTLSQPSASAVGHSQICVDEIWKGDNCFSQLVPNIWLSMVIRESAAGFLEGLQKIAFRLSSHNSQRKWA
jgi:hypothetical protein